MAHPDRITLLRLRRIYETYFCYLERMFEHLADTTDPRTILTLINETLLELWHSSCASRAPAAVNEWVLRCAIKQVRRFLLQQASPPAGCGLLSALSVDERAVVYLTYTGHARAAVAGIMRLPCGGVDELMARARTRLHYDACEKITFT
jgi:DNA-directed RNA polymerase specialized sigma24 family protein